jgi:hypothetical protein
MKTGMIQDEQVGPVADGAFLQLAFDGKIKPKTLVVHATHTRGQWVQMEQIPAARTKYDEGVRLRQQQKDEQARAKEESRRAQEASLHAQRQAAINAAAEQRAQSPISRFLVDGQSESVVAKLFDRVSQILTQNENIEYIAVQAKPIAIAPDCVVITNRRFIVFHQKVFGQMQFEDYLWLYLYDARIREGVMYAEISLRATDGRVIGINYLPKAQARRIYRIAQQREEEVMEVRRARAMEEQRAGASNIVVNASAPTAQVPPAPQPGTPAPPTDDPVAKLQKLKQMLDQGLIQQSEYDAAKAKVLASL